MSNVNELLKCIYTMDESSIEKLIADGVDVNCADKYRRSALSLSITRNMVKTGSLLINAGADVNNRGIDGRTPLQDAAWMGQTEICKMLIEANADINAKNKHGETPLHWAVQNGTIDTIKLLIKRGVRLNEPTNLGITPLGIAIDRGWKDAEELLKDAIESSSNETEQEIKGKKMRKTKAELVAELSSTNDTLRTLNVTSIKMRKRLKADISALELERDQLKKEKRDLVMEQGFVKNKVNLYDQRVTTLLDMVEKLMNEKYENI